MREIDKKVIKNKKEFEVDSVPEASSSMPEDIYGEEVLVEHGPRDKGRQDLEAVREDLRRELQRRGEEDEGSCRNGLEQERIRRAQQEAVLPKEEFYKMFGDGEYTKEVLVETGRVPWRFWQGPEETILDVSPPEGFLEENIPPLVIIGGLGSGITTYLENIYEAITSGRRVIFMNPSRTFKARENDSERIHDLEVQSEKLMPEIADELMEAGEISESEHELRAKGGNIPDTFIRKASAGMQILEELGIDEFDMIGHSQGGIVSAGIVALAGNRVRVWNPISPAGMHGSENAALLAARFTHEQVHRGSLGRFSKIYRALGIVAEKLGILRMLYRSEGANRGGDYLEEYLAHPKPTEEQREEEMGPRGNKKTSKVESLKPTRIGGMAWAGVRMSQTDAVPLLHVMRGEGLRTKIPLMVAHGEATFPEDRILRNTKGINMWPYSTINPYDGHDFEKIEMRNVLEILELEDELDAKGETKEKATA